MVHCLLLFFLLKTYIELLIYANGMINDPGPACTTDVSVVLLAGWGGG